MSCFTWLLIVRSAATVLIGQNYTARQALSGESTVTNCVFDVTSGYGTSNGGGLFFDQMLAAITVTGCTFRNCRVQTPASWGGGAFYISECSGATVNRTTGTDCSATALKGGFGLVSVRAGTSGSAFQVADTSMATCDSGSETLALDCPDYTIGPSAKLARINATACHATTFASTMMFFEHNNPSAQFVILSGNHGGNTIGFAYIAGNHTIRCFAVVNNSCQSVGGYNGMIGIFQPMTISDSVFQANTADWFVGIKTGGASTTLTFVRCVFDSAAASGSSHTVSVVRSSCVTTQQAAELPTCMGTFWATGTTSRSATPSEPFTEPWSAVMGPRILLRMACFVIAWAPV